ncbi:MAG: thioredoxin family protein [bacterium]
MIKIQVVGAGCANCRKLEEVCRQVVAENAVEAEVEKVTDISRFADLGIMVTPGLVIDGEVKASGKVPQKEQISTWVMNAAAAAR